MKEIRYYQILAVVLSHLRNLCSFQSLRDPGCVRNAIDKFLAVQFISFHERQSLLHAC